MPLYVVVHNGEHYVGGTKSGVQFIRKCGAYVPYSFIGYLSAKESGEMYNYSNRLLYFVR